MTKLAQPSISSVWGGNVSATISGEVFSLLAETLTQIRSVMMQDPAAASRYIDRVEFLLTRSRPASDRAEQAETTSGGLAPWQMHCVKRYIEANLAENITTAELAAHVRLSGNHFARTFKTSLGCPPHAYVVLRRIAHARELMIGTNDPLSQIALSCGLSDQAHLSRLFRRIVGVSPSVWRRQHGNAGPADSLRGRTVIHPADDSSLLQVA